MDKGLTTFPVAFEIEFVKSKKKERLREKENLNSSVRLMMPYSPARSEQMVKRGLIYIQRKKQTKKQVSRQRRGLGKQFRHLTVVA